MDERRRWGRIKVPDKKLLCKITEPEGLSLGSTYAIDDINPGGISFFSEKKIKENLFLKLLIKFPFTTFEEAGVVWGKVIYCLKIHDQEKYIIGVSFISRGKYEKQPVI